MTTATGPGSPAIASANACRIAAAIWLTSSTWKTPLVTGFEQRDLVEAVDLERPVLFALGDVADDGDERDRIDQRLADAGERVGHAGSGHDAEHAGLAGRAGVAVGHRRRGELVRAEQVGQALRLHRVPEFVLLSAGDAVDALAAFLDQRLDDRHRPGHLAFDPARRCAAAGLVRRHSGTRAEGRRRRPPRARGFDGSDP